MGTLIICLTILLCNLAMTFGFIYSVKLIADVIKMAVKRFGNVEINNNVKVEGNNNG